MSLWELAACIDGHNKANGGDDAGADLTAEDIARLSRLIDEDSR